jgi:hypothetical protein
MQTILTAWDETAQEAEQETLIKKGNGDLEPTLETILIGGHEAAPQATIEPIFKEKKRGRKRKYLEKGKYQHIAVAEVIRFRYLYGRYIDGVSKEQQDEFEYKYFTPPNRRKDKGKGTFTAHQRAWQRREEWLAPLGGTRNSAITYLPTERAARGRRAYVER